MKTIQAEKYGDSFGFDDEESGVFFIGAWDDLIEFAKMVFGDDVKVETAKAA